ncbi:MAG: hypothetical protein GY950_15745, partial [bacterium]|nr:hypothetical protein [bacterium]
MMKKMLIILFIILLLAIPVIAGAVKSNPDKPLKGNWDFKLKKTWTLDSAGEDVFAAPAVEVSDDETLCVRDWKNRCFYLFTAAGEFKKAFGKLGEGPGEVRSHYLPCHTVNDMFIVTGIDRLHYFTTKGEFVKSVPYNPVPVEPRFFMDENRFIGAHVLCLPGREGEIRRVNLITNHTQVIKKYKIPMDGNSRRRVPTLLGLTPMMITGYDYHNHELYYGINNSYEIRRADMKGNT